MINQIKRIVCYFLYYGLACHLPGTDFPLGKIFCSWRAFCCYGMFDFAGKDLCIERKVFFHSGKHIRIGNHSGLGENCQLRGKVTIGKHVMMGRDVVMISRNHAFDRIDIPMREQGFLPVEPIVIGDDVWIGDRVIILAGVKIGKGVILGAGTVVAKSIPDWAIVVGNPAKILRFRNDQRTDKKEVIV